MFHDFIYSIYLSFSALDKCSNWKITQIILEWCFSVWSKAPSLGEYFLGFDIPQQMAANCVEKCWMHELVSIWRAELVKLNWLILSLLLSGFQLQQKHTKQDFPWTHWTLGIGTFIKYLINKLTWLLNTVRMLG